MGCPSNGPTLHYLAFPPAMTTRCGLVLEFFGQKIGGQKNKGSLNIGPLRAPVAFPWALSVECRMLNVDEHSTLNIQHSTFNAQGNWFYPKYSDPHSVTSVTSCNPSP